MQFTTTGTGTFKGNKKSNPKLGERGKKTVTDEVQINLIFEFHKQTKFFKPFSNFIHMKRWHMKYLSLKMKTKILVWEVSVI